MRFEFIFSTKVKSPLLSCVLLIVAFSAHAQIREESSVEAIALQADGKIVAGGTSSLAGTSRFALARFDSNGKTDASFGEQGKVTAFTGKGSKLFAIAIQGDGKIVGAGYADTGRSHAVALARFNSDGKLDDSFGKAGFVTTETGLNYARAFDVFLQPDGKLIAVGHSNTKPAGGFDFLAMRYNRDGSLDKSFGIGGIVHTRVGTNNNGGQGGALQADGKILIAGHYAAGKVSRFAVARYMPNGRPDMSFGTGGKAILPVSGSASSILPLSDGRILVGGNDNKLADSSTLLVTLLSRSGKVDPSFGNKGTSTIGKGNIQALRASFDGSYVVTGWYFGANTRTESETASSAECHITIKFDLTGSRPRPNGLINNDDFACYANDIAIQPDKKTVVGGWIWRSKRQAFVIFRFNEDGSPDSSFGDSGQVVTAFAN